jgi:hypothetical protein
VNAPTIPDYVVPIVGYRVWNWHANELLSLNGEPWVLGRALAARCHKTNHEPPADECSCGVYAAKSYEQFQGIGGDINALQGEVYLWGKVVEHELGYRAQFAYPKSFTLPLSIDTRFERSRLQHLSVYEADIFLAPDSLLWTKRFGYTAVGQDLLKHWGDSCGEWCKQWHDRRPQQGEYVMVLGRGLGSVQRDDCSSGCSSENVRIRLRNDDVFIVPEIDIIWNCRNWRWEIDLSRYTETFIVWKSRDREVLCRGLIAKTVEREQSLNVVPPASGYRRVKLASLASKTKPIHNDENPTTRYLDADYIDAQSSLHHACTYLNRLTLSSKIAQADADAVSILNEASQTLDETFRRELLARSIAREEDR